MKDEHFEKLFEEMLRESGTESLERLYDEYTKKYPDENEPIPDELDEMVRSLVDDVTEAPAAAAAEHGSAEVAELSGHKKKGFFRRHYRIVAVLALVVFIGGAYTMSVEAWRIKIFNLVLEVTNGKIMVGAQSEEGTKDLVEISDDVKFPREAPKGYHITDQQQSDNGVIFAYSNGENQILFEQRGAEDSVFYESPIGQEREIYISGNKGYILEENGYIKIVWSDGTNVYKLSGDCIKEDLVKMANSVK
ncbi:DUF4367 domain-containing protein [Intestinibacillus massiliensis]|uniref:DUF4367 domain-containing protein n=1 Tax=Intestinibacillus massiliensis TaxID=1871029 RepID=UPI001356443F|nr:DUF4367 domain-containing protein [Intestinibacillus massiliensis]